MKRIDTMTEEAKDALLRSILEANKNFESILVCEDIPCDRCPLKFSIVGCMDRLTVGCWCEWAEEEVKNETDI